MHRIGWALQNMGVWGILVVAVAPVGHLLVDHVAAVETSTLSKVLPSSRAAHTYKVIPIPISFPVKLAKNLFVSNGIMPSKERLTPRP